MSSNLFRTVCNLLNLPPEHVRSMRLNPKEAVVVTTTPAGELQVATVTGDGELRLGVPTPLRPRAARTQPEV